jgi:hypothetical protein
VLAADGAAAGRGAAALAQAARTVGSPQIRSAATIGEEPRHRVAAATSCPSSRPSTPRSSCGRNGSRVLSIHDFLVGPKRTALQPGSSSRGGGGAAEGTAEFMKVGVRKRDGHRDRNLALVVDHGR